MKIALPICVLLCATIAAGQTGLRRIEIGSQYTYFHQQSAYLPDQNLLGFRADMNVARSLAIDSQLDIGVRYLPVPMVSSINGGRLILGRFGVKAGKRGKRFGIFGQARPGFMTVSETITYLRSGYPMKFGRITEPLLNLGVSLEHYTFRRAGLRLDVGDTVIFYSKRQIIPGAAPSNGVRKHNTDISIGGFYRF